MPNFADQDQDQQYSSVNTQNQEQQQQQQQNSNKTGLPDDLKAKLEAHSGLDLSQVKVYYNSPLPAALGAHAFTRGMNIYLAPGAEQYLSEEAMHLIQQLQGQVAPEKQLTDGKETTAINENEGLEKDAVTTGKQLEKAPLPTTTPKQLKKPTVPTEEVVQMATKSSHYGDFTIDDAKYDFTDATKSKLVFEVEFKPNDDVDTTKVGLVQSINSEINGNDVAKDPNEATKMTANGDRIDMSSALPNPLYAVDTAVPNTGTRDATKLEDYSTDPGYGEHAEKDATGWKNNARLYDAPSVDGGANSQKEFETAALALNGGDKGEYYGSVKWGWITNGGGVTTKIPFDLISEGVPTKNFLASAEAWNAGKTRGTVKTKEDNVSVVNRRGEEQFKLAKDITVEYQGAIELNRTVHNRIKVKEGPNINQVGYVLVSKLKDMNDGTDTVDLPIPGIKIPKEDNLHFGANKDQCLVTDPLLPLGTRMKIIEEDGNMVKVEIVQGPKTGDQGWVEKAAIKDE